MVVVAGPPLLFCRWGAEDGVPHSGQLVSARVPVHYDVLLPPDVYGLFDPSAPLRALPINNFDIPKIHEMVVVPCVF